MCPTTSAASLPCVWRLTTSTGCSLPGIALNGIDGLYVHGNHFFAVQNGTSPARVIRFSVNLAKQEVLEANTPRLGEPTHGTFVGEEFYFLANSGWNEYDREGHKKEGSSPVESEVRKLN